MTEQELRDPSRQPSREGVLRAAAKIAALLPPTPLLPLEVDGRTLWCKAEMLQPIGAFKIRGAWHRLSDLDEGERARGVVGVSSGNHAQGVAWAARRLGVAATIVMPRDAPHAKMAATRALGATVVPYDRAREDRDVIAAGLVAESGAILVHAYGDPWIIEGQGTTGVEAATQLEARIGRRPDRIIAPCGGGGLAAGLALACPEAQIAIAEPEGWDDVLRSLAAGAITGVADMTHPTDCDALQTPRTFPINFALLKARVSGGAAVTRAEVRAAMRLAFERLHLVVEPGGAAALAAALAGKVATTDATVVLLSGGNVDQETFMRLIGD
ncbi:MAG TPA: pyridoxal-phosphate dependent enzyme [Sphingobium sp.]|nr:pyridoxal-phosphate dependent enzyme [Sphingobium sp.]